ncbi:hypothetical protein ACC745_38560, partial [Rhizobium ruizarguesonis]
MTQLATMLVIRTPGPIWRSRPSPLLFGTALAVGAAGVTIPYTAVGGLSDDENGRQLRHERFHEPCGAELVLSG